ncbi:MAG TPA: polysaccharide deacetylase family protein [Coleofasciculaceae cyanobacterium]|jgi:peptidoglycan/xylan/chitin deacetylase (PgdA/CDA1 family)
MEVINVNSQKNTNFSISLALGFIIFLSIVILQSTDPIIPVFGFHGIIDPEAPGFQSDQVYLHYPKQDLEKFLEYLVSHDFWFLTAQDSYDFFLTKSKEIPVEHLSQNPIMISFDDGYKSVYTKLMPILYKLEKKYDKKVKVVLFINPGTLANRESITSTHIGCRELREGLKKGFYDIQSHGLNHKNLTKIAPQQIANELLQAQTKLRNCTKELDPEQKVASHFAYPYGAYNQQVKDYTSKYYLSAYLYDNQRLSHSFLKNYYEIPRLIISRKKSAQQLIEMVDRVHSMKR